VILGLKSDMAALIMLMLQTLGARGVPHALHANPRQRLQSADWLPL